MLTDSSFVVTEIQPLPQSYAAVVHAFLQKEDIETAVAVYAANRRQKAVSSEKSWTALTTALFSTGRDNDRALALLDLVSDYTCGLVNGQTLKT